MPTFIAMFPEEVIFELRSDANEDLARVRPRPPPSRARRNDIPPQCQGIRSSGRVTRKSRHARTLGVEIEFLKHLDELPAPHFGGHKRRQYGVPACPSSAPGTYEALPSIGRYPDRHQVRSRARDLRPVSDQGGVDGPTQGEAGLPAIGTVSWLTLPRGGRQTPQSVAEFLSRLRDGKPALATTEPLRAAPTTNVRSPARRVAEQQLKRTSPPVRLCLLWP